MAACLYHRINDLSFLRHAGAQLHSAGGLFFLRMAWDALHDFFPIDCGWLRGMALVVLDFAWHGIGDWRRDTFSFTDELDFDYIIETYAMLKG